MVDPAIAARKLAAIRDAVARVRDVLPETPGELAGNRDTREIVVLNLFVALQECVSLAAHWLSDAGLDVPESYREVFLALGAREALPEALASRLAAAAGFRNLVAHQYGVLDAHRVHAIARADLKDLLTFCDAVAAATSGESQGS